MVGYGIYGLGTAIAGVVFACGVLFQRVNNHSKRLDAGDKKLNEHTERVTTMTADIEYMRGDITEIKADVKTLLRNNRK